VATVEQNFYFAIDVYLRSLVEELLLLWHEESVRMWDEYRQ
jgi:hypothetical protein